MLNMDFSKISLVISAFNEQNCIQRTLITIHQYMAVDFAGQDWELLVVNDGSTDCTLHILKSMMGEIPQLKVINSIKNGGQGKGFQKAFGQASGEVIVTLDADLSYDVKHIGTMLEKMYTTGADMVIASAFLEGTRIFNVPKHRKIMTICANKILSFSSSLDVSAITCAVRAYRSSAIRYLPLGSHGMEINLEAVLKAEIFGLHIEEVPAVLKWSEAGRAGSIKKKSRRSYLNLFGTIYKYSFFSMLFNPSILFTIPQILLIPVFLIYFTSLCYRFVNSFFNFLSSGQVWNFALSNSLRLTFETYQHGFYIALVSAMVSMFLFLAWFISKQNKFYFEQNHIIMSRILEKIDDN